jgi:hypothetical protein
LRSGRRRGLSGPGGAGGEEAADRRAGFDQWPADEVFDAVFERHGFFTSGFDVGGSFVVWGRSPWWYSSGFGMALLVGL